MKVLKWIGIGLVVLIVLGLLLPDSDAQAETKEGVATEASAVVKDDIEVISMKDTKTDMLSTVHVEVKNNTSKLLTAGQIKVIYKGKDGGIVGTGNGAILNLAAGKTKVVDCLAMGVEGASTYEVQVEPMIYE